MHKRVSALCALCAVFAAAPAIAADYAPAAHEVWSGVYRCGPMHTESGTAPGYTSSIRLIVQGKAATINKQSGEISENLSGEVAGDGTLRLEGTGTRRGSGAQWRYRYHGRFEGSRFQARGMMYSVNLATKLRDCSMTLARMQRSDKPALALARDAAVDTAAPERAPVEVSQAQPQPQSTVPAPEGVPAQEPLNEQRAPAPPSVIDRELDFSDGNDSAVMEGTVERGVPHRYHVIAKKGQRLSATLQSDAGARFDLYEPGSSITLLEGGFVVQGARLAANEEGTHVDTKLPTDGRYLLLVRSVKDSALYTLDIIVEGGPPTLLQRWWLANKAWFIAAGAAALLLVILILRRRKRDRRMFRPD